MLLKMSIAFIRPGVSDVPERQWSCAIFAAQTGQIQAAKDLAKKSAEGKAEFRELLPTLFPRCREIAREDIAPRCPGGTLAATPWRIFCFPKRTCAGCCSFS